MHTPPHEVYNMERMWPPRPMPPGGHGAVSPGMGGGYYMFSRNYAYQH